MCSLHLRDGYFQPTYRICNCEYGVVGLFSWLEAGGDDGFPSSLSPKTSCLHVVFWWTSKWGLSSDKFNNLWLFSVSKGPSSTSHLEELGINFLWVLPAVFVSCFAWHHPVFFRVMPDSFETKAKLLLTISAVYFYPGYVIVRATQMMSPLSIWKYHSGESWHWLFYLGFLKKQ